MSENAERAADSTNDAVTSDPVEPDGTVREDASMQNPAVQPAVDAVEIEYRQCHGLFSVVVACWVWDVM